MGELDLPMYAGIATVVFCVTCLGCWAIYSMMKERRKRRNSGFIDNDTDDVENRLDSSSRESTSHRRPLDQHHHRHQRRIKPHVQTGRTSGSTNSGSKSHNNSPHLSRKTSTSASVTSTVLPSSQSDASTSTLVPISSNPPQRLVVNEHRDRGSATISTRIPSEPEEPPGYVSS